MCADATTPGEPRESLAADSRAAVLLVVFVALLVAVPVAAAQPTDRATPFDENETDGEDGTAANATTTTENGTTDDATTTHDASTPDAATTSNLTTTSSPTTTQTAATLPENVTYTVVVYPTAERVVVRAEYTTYSSAEAARAENGTLDSSWFDGEERLREAFAAREGDDELVPSSNLTSRAVFPEAEYTDVIVEREFEWHGVFAPEEKREVIGPHVAESFRPGDRLVVEVFEWEPETVNTDAEPTSHPRNVRYDWTIGEGDEPPRIVFNRTVVDDEEGSATGTDLPFSPAAGGLLSVVALLCFVLLARNRRTP